MTTRPDAPVSHQTGQRSFPTRIKHNPVAALISVAFVVLVPVLLLLAGLVIPGDGGRNPFTSTNTLLRQASGDGLVLVVLILLVTALGGWRSVLTEPRRVRSWWGGGTLIAFAVVTLLAFTTPTGATASYLAALFVAVIAVALVEELVYRGVLVAGLRRVAPEWIVWLVSSAAFALTHIVNTNNGGLFQVLMTFFLGSACYLARRLTGSLLGAIVVHILYNAFIGYRTQALDGFPVILSVASTLLVFVTAVIGFIAARRRNVR